MLPSAAFADEEANAWNWFEDPALVDESSTAIMASADQAQEDDEVQELLETASVGCVAINVCAGGGGTYECIQAAQSTTSSLTEMCSPGAPRCTSKNSWHVEGSYSVSNPDDDTKVHFTITCDSATIGGCYAATDTQWHCVSIEFKGTGGLDCHWEIIEGDGTVVESSVSGSCVDPADPTNVIPAVKKPKLPVIDPVSG